MGDDESREGRARSTRWLVGVLDRIDARFPRFGRVIVMPVRAIAARYQHDDLPTHAGALTYGACLSLPPLLLLAVSVIGFAISDPRKQEQVIDSFVDLIPGLDAVAASLVDSVVSGRVALGLDRDPGRAVGSVGIRRSAAARARRRVQNPLERADQRAVSGDGRLDTAVRRSAGRARAAGKRVGAGRVLAW